jgi:hypothetical protein
MDRLLNLLAFVGQPILAAAAFQAALSRHARVFAPGERSPKAGGRQDWPPHNLSGLVSGIQRKCIGSSTGGSACLILALEDKWTAF